MEKDLLLTTIQKHLHGEQADKTIALCNGVLEGYYDKKYSISDVVRILHTNFCNISRFFDEEKLFYYFYYYLQRVKLTDLERTQPFDDNIGDLNNPDDFNGIDKIEGLMKFAQYYLFILDNLPLQEEYTKNMVAMSLTRVLEVYHKYLFQNNNKKEQSIQEEELRNIRDEIALREFAESKESVLEFMVRFGKGNVVDSTKTLKLSTNRSKQAIKMLREAIIKNTEDLETLQNKEKQYSLICGADWKKSLVPSLIRSIVEAMANCGIFKEKPVEHHTSRRPSRPSDGIYHLCNAIGWPVEISNLHLVFVYDLIKFVNKDLVKVKAGNSQIENAETPSEKADFIKQRLRSKAKRFTLLEESVTQNLEIFTTFK